MNEQKIIMTAPQINEAVRRKLHPGLKPLTPNEFQQSEYHAVPRLYCSDIKAAWEVVEFLQSIRNLQGFALWTPEYSGPHTKIAFKILTGKTILEEIADTAPMAICLAFLKLPDPNAAQKPFDVLKIINKFDNS